MDAVENNTVNYCLLFSVTKYPIEAGPEREDFLEFILSECSARGCFARYAWGTSWKRSVWLRKLLVLCTRRVAREEEVAGNHGSL